MDPATAFTSTAAAISHGQVSELQLSEDYAIKSEAVTPKLGESSFPLNDLTERPRCWELVPRETPD